MNEKLLADVRIILVEPAGALNVGAIARTLKNMGLSQLVLVNPDCDPLGEEARMMAVHAGDILENAKITRKSLDFLVNTKTTPTFIKLALNFIIISF